MKLQFDANQTYQADAVNAVVDLFDGQMRGVAEFTVVASTRERASAGLYESAVQNELGIGNQLSFGDERLVENTRKVQARNEIEAMAAGAGLEVWELFDGPLNRKRTCAHFSVEMETGTGKTYVYLRTIFELHKRYGMSKFIIVVPGVAIREGVLKSIEITAEHFRALYDGVAFESFVYDGQKTGQLRQFALSTGLQVMVINIDAFRKDFSGEESAADGDEGAKRRKSNVMYKESDKLSGRAPIEFVQATRPIVVIDEPQSVDNTEGAQEAIRRLNPLCTLRYSATHRNPYNLVYRLDPVRAFELKLVKQIVVANAQSTGGAGNDAMVRLESVDNTKGIRARLRINVQHVEGPKEKSITVKIGDDLFSKSEGAGSKGRAEYQSGFEVTEISADPKDGYVRFSSGRTLRVGEQWGGMRDDVWRVQIRKTIEAHLKREVRMLERKAAGHAGIKVLSLFFVDRVANYREYPADGPAVKGKFARFFEEAIGAFSREERFKAIGWLREPVEKLHDGYFSMDGKGSAATAKDTSGTTKADHDTYTLIMRDKERLLSESEPLRFIFSHSALREGWDNPNVFQICTLAAAQGAVRKRQEIGRGLRLPVDENGQRVFDDSVNQLYVMANESYEDFARAIQGEYEADCGVTFGKVPRVAIDKIIDPESGAGLAIGRARGGELFEALIEGGMLDKDGRIQPAFKPEVLTFSLGLKGDLKPLEAAAIDLLRGYQLSRHIKKEGDTEKNVLRKEVFVSPEFAALWERISARTTYRVEFDTATLIEVTTNALRVMETIPKPRVAVTVGALRLTRGGVTGELTASSTEAVEMQDRPVPDVLAYLQNETNLTRGTLAKILTASGRLDEFFNDPQRFMDQAARLINAELNRVVIGGIKYEKLDPNDPNPVWEQLRIKEVELVDLLQSLVVTKSVYERVEYESEVEKRFAMGLESREDIKLFVKLPRWFRVDTPVGEYIPDWAILKLDGEALYLARETKSDKRIEEQPTVEGIKVRCGKKHFAAIGVPFAVVTSAAEV